MQTTTQRPNHKRIRVWAVLALIAGITLLILAIVVGLLSVLSPAPMGVGEARTVAAFGLSGLGLVWSAVFHFSGRK